MLIQSIYINHFSLLFISYKELKEWYFKDTSIIPGDITSLAPTYPTHSRPLSNIKL